jgi:predicted nucleic acid-binding protein
VKIVLDASVVVAAERAAEPGHARSRAVVDRILRGEDEVVVPAIFRIEVVAALARRGHDAAGAERLVDALLASPAETVTLGPRTASRVARFAARHRLRAADACYASIAFRRGVPLITLDEEMIRLAPGIEVRGP